LYYIVIKLYGSSGVDSETLGSAKAQNGPVRYLDRIDNTAL